MKKFYYPIIICFSTCVFSCSSLYYHPSKIEYYTPETFGFSYDPISVTGTDGVKLNLWRIYSPKVKQPKGIILQFHGNGENMSSHFLSLTWLVNYGYELITYDYRGYGKSEGDPNPNDILLDSKIVLDYALFHSKTMESKLVVYGQSLGGAIAMRSIAEWDHKADVKLLCLDGTFASYREVTKQTINRVLFWPLGNLMSIFFHDSTSPKNHISDLTPIPLLIIHGTEDSVVDFENGKEIFKIANDPKVFWEIKGGGHVNWMNLGQTSFAKDFLKLLDRHLY